MICRRHWNQRVRESSVAEVLERPWLKTHLKTGRMAGRQALRVAMQHSRDGRDARADVVP